MGELGKRLDTAQRKDLKGLQMSDWDRKNIGHLIDFYEKAYPGVIAQVAHEARLDTVDETQFNKPTDKFKISRRMAIPEGLLLELKRAYPSIIIDKRQLNQFLRWYPQFDLWVR